jgi:immune inhibitor A
VIVVLPDKPVDFDFGAPAAGSKFYYSGSADDLDTTMTRSVTLPAGTPSLTAQIRTNIETDWDYAYVTVNGNPVPTNLSVNTNPNGNNLGNGITGPRSSWTAVSASLTAYAGQTVTIGFRYKTDAAQQGQPGASGVPGFQVDEIAISGQPTDGAETDAGWTFTPKEGGFHVTGQTVTRYFFNAYVAENRQYLGYDAGLRTGPYNFGGTNGANWAERFPLQDGLLVWYWDNSFGDNNVGEHPGGGLILPVDANPAPLHWADGRSTRRSRRRRPTRSRCTTAASPSPSRRGRACRRSTTARATGFPAIRATLRQTGATRPSGTASRCRTRARRCVSPA